MIDPHWYQFPPLNPLWHSILGFAIFVLGMVSMIGNYVRQTKHKHFIEFLLKQNLFFR